MSSAAARSRAGSRSGRPESFRPGPAQAALLLDDPLWTKLAKAKAAAQDALSGRVLPRTAKMRARPARSARPVENHLQIGIFCCRDANDRRPLSIPWRSRVG